VDRVVLRRVGPGELGAADTSGLAELYEQVAGDFVPPLTFRSGTTQSGLRDLERANSGDYLEQMLGQDLIVATQADRVIGFLSFRARYEDPRFPHVCPCIYVSTIAVRHDQRRNGIARQLYTHLFELPADLPDWVVLRTWSTNTGHLRLLADLGFAIILSIPDDRAENIDTVYLAAPRRVTSTDDETGGSSNTTARRVPDYLA
jgi:ribosomal protein S18 acetylase RimI-like enzyme